MSEFDKYMDTQLSDGRKMGAFKAACDACRSGMPQDKAIELITLKASSKDGLDADVAKRKVIEAYSLNKQSLNNKKINAVVKESINSKELQIDWSPIQVTEPNKARTTQLKEYIQAVFKPGDYIAICTRPIYNKDDKKYFPVANLLCRYERLLEEIDNNGDLVNTLDQSIENGAYVIINPVTGMPGQISEHDIIDHRHCLVECDHLPLDQQMAALVALNLPIAALTYSGGKSLHAVVKIGSGRNWKQFKERVEFVYRVLDMALFRNDVACKNSNRWTRLAGFSRLELDPKKESIQYLVATNIGAASYEEWETLMIEKISCIPSPTDFSFVNAEPQAEPEVIEGILRSKGRMLVSAAPKKGKSMLLMQLALALSSGRTWLGYRCAKLRVMYFDLELGKSECITRFFNLGKAMAIDQNEYPYLQNVSPADVSPDSLAKTIIYRCKQYNIEVVIIDPVYSLIGDEISSQEVKKLVNMINVVIANTGAAVIYCHHNNKGNANSSQHNHTDRISGSGVFARSADALFTYNLDSRNRGKAFLTLRGFRMPDPLHLKFEYPIFTIEEKATSSTVVDNVDDATRAKTGRKQKVSGEQIKQYMINNPKASAQDIVTEFNISISLAYERLKQVKDELAVYNSDVGI